MMGIIANATKNILPILLAHILQNKNLNRKFLFVPAPLHAQTSQVEFSNQDVCFIIKKEKNSKVDGSSSAAVRNLMLK